MDTQVVRNPVDVIVRKIRRFPQETRRYIINAALLDLDRDLMKPNGPDRYAILKSIAEKATGHILTDSRSRENTEVPDANCIPDAVRRIHTGRNRPVDGKGPQYGKALLQPSGRCNAVSEDVCRTAYKTKDLLKRITGI